MSDPASGPKDFATTHWSLVLAIHPGTDDQSRARHALAELCRAYWYPLYAYVRFRGHGADEAQDLTQAFFARLIETKGLSSADPEQGRFRSYLLGAMKHFLANDRQRRQTKKRGGDVRFIALDALDLKTRYALPAETDDPDLAFDRQWAVATLDRVLEKMRDNYASRDRGELFDALKGALVGETPDPEQVADLGLSEGALKVAVHRLRKRFRTGIRAEIANTVQSPEQIDSEMRYLVDILRQP